MACCQPFDQDMMVTMTTTVILMMMAMNQSDVFHIKSPPCEFNIFNLEGTIENIIIDNGMGTLLEAEVHAKIQNTNKEESLRRVAYFRDKHRQAELVHERVCLGSTTLERTWIGGSA
eukprot:6467180-Amphidinium_carterae.1